VILDIPADTKYLETVSACLITVLDRGPAPEKGKGRYFPIKLAVHETCTNIIEHAYRGQAGRIRIEIEICTDPAKIVVELFDQGAASEQGPLTEPNLDEPQTKGYGLFLINKIVDDIEYRRDKGINRWRLVKNL